MGVYLPCLDLEVELYRDSLVELEWGFTAVGLLLVTSMPTLAPCGDLEHTRAQTSKVFYSVKSLIDANSMLCCVLG